MMIWPFYGNNDKKGETTELNLIIGEDRRIVKKALVSTGAFFIDEDNQLAWDNVRSSMGIFNVSHAKPKKAQKDAGAQIGLLFELSSSPWNFKDMKWEDKSSQVSTMITDARLEGYNIACKEENEDKRWEKLMPILAFGLGILALVVILALVSSGVFSKAAEAF